MDQATTKICFKKTFIKTNLTKFSMKKILILPSNSDLAVTSVLGFAGAVTAILLLLLTY